MSSVVSSTTVDDGSFGDVPEFSAEAIPREIKMPRWVWANVYRLLRDAPNQCLTMHDVVVEHSKKFKKSIGGKALYRQCGVQKLVELLCALPFTEPVRVHGVMKFQLRPPDSTYPPYSFRDKMQKMEPKKSLLARQCQSESDFEDFDDDEEFTFDAYGFSMDSAARPISMDDDYKGLVPKQPAELLPRWGEMPDELRQKIYRLLESSFQNGVELKVFRDAFTKHYSSSISNKRDCKMPYDEMFYCLKDILEIMISDGKMWLKPRSRAEIRELHAKRPSEIFSVDPIFATGQRLNKKEEYMKKQRDNRVPYFRRQKILHPLNSRLEPLKSNQVTGPPSTDRLGADYPATLTPMLSPVVAAAGRPYYVDDSEEVNGDADIDDFEEDDDDGQKPCGSGHGCGSGPQTANGLLESSDMKINKNAISRILRSNERSNAAAVAKIKKSAAYNLQEWENADSAEHSGSPNTVNSPPQHRRIEIEIKNLLASKSDSWIPHNNIFNFYAKFYNRSFIFPDSYGKTVLDLLEKFPELFSLDKECNVKIRPEPEKDGEVPESAEVTAFGIQEGDVFIGPFKCLQLVEGEQIRVLISAVKSNGDFYIQFKDMDSSFSDMDIDLNECYENPFKNETYAIPDCLCVGMPVVVSSKEGWRRAKILGIDSDVIYDFQAEFCNLLNEASRTAEILHVVVKSRRAKDGVVLVDLTAMLENGLRVNLNEVAQNRGLARVERVELLAMGVGVPRPRYPPLNNLNSLTPPCESFDHTDLLTCNQFYDSDHSNPNNLAVESAQPNDLPCSSTESKLTKSIGALSLNKTTRRKSKLPADDQPSTSSSAPLKKINPKVEAILSMLYTKLNDPETPDEDKEICLLQISAIFDPKS